MDRPDSSLSEQATAILRLIADGRSYDQILMRRPDLTYQDIFAAAQEALAKLHPGQTDVLSRPPAPTQLADIQPADTQSTGTQPARRPSFIEKARQTHHRAWARWTPDEDEQLARLFHRGAHLAEIGQALGRHNGAIRSRLAKLGLLPEDIDDPDQLLTPGGRRTPPANEPAPSATPGASPAPPRSSFGWDTIRRRLERPQDRE